MRKLTEDEIWRYSAILPTPCGEEVFVWRSKEFKTQDQMKDHLEECKACKKVLEKFNGNYDEWFPKRHEIKKLSEGSDRSGST